ncbi:M20 family metallopeptidase [Patescibacteria group bacterium]|nr:M20 family metallopeptidase [Patescibacteria group bacterium]
MPIINQNLLKKIIAIRSDKNETEVGDILRNELELAGFLVQETEVELGRKNLLATKNYKKGKKSILFYGHLDTVSPLSGWNPFEPTIKGDKMFGLGAYDMKGGIIAFLEASKNSSAYIKIFLAVDEENISKGVWTSLEKDRDFFSDVELVISAEPNFDLGLNGITRGRTGRAIFQVDFTGKAAHVAKYKDGIDAIELATNWVNKLYSVRNNIFNSKETVALVRKFNGEAIGMSVCASASIEVEVLSGHRDSLANIKGALEKISNEVSEEIKIELKKRETPYLEGYYFESFPYQKEIGGIIKETTDKNMTLHERTSVGDDNALASLGIPVITWGPNGGNAHNVNEWVSLSSLDLLCTMYKKLLSNR